MPIETRRESQPTSDSHWKFWTTQEGAVNFAMHLAIFLILLCAIPLGLFGAGTVVATIAGCGAAFFWLFWTFISWATGRSEKKT